MKTETQIAEEELKGCGQEREFTNRISYYCGKLNSERRITYCDECEKVIFKLRASCQRFLGFLEDWYAVLPPNEKCPECIEIMPEMEKKITDLKNAIKKYVEAGI
ncbi:hypothetical protein LCGC14_0545990 [marine sediment metagenome]|uniref:Uncharacterized protein n=1 Tax=marine sediment metagenome TaxID=412755 RepID=A0A0F9RW42_9ZZZZ